MLEKRKIIEKDDINRALKIKGELNSIADFLIDGKVEQRRVYDSEGKSSFDIDVTPHNRIDLHPTGAHKNVEHFTSCHHWMAL